MKKFILFTCSIAISFQLSAQQADNWYFGIFAGLNFSASTPAVLTDGKVNTPEGCSSISDTSGALLFYTDGNNVWNKLHFLMPNGSGLDAGSSATQAALIAQQPGSNNLYYVFTLDEIGGPLGFRYSIVDMSLQSGLGDVIEKNILLQNSVTEKLTAVTTYDGSKIWVVVHEWGSNAFYSYALTTSGISTPVISNAGIIHSTAEIQNTYGQMKFASCGGLLALAIGYQDTIEIFDFNLVDGTVSDPITIPIGYHVYGIEFSPDDSKLYVTNYNPEATLLQFDLTQGSADAIINSKVTLNSTEDLYALQLAPDGKIYVVKSFSTYLGIINEPDIAGSGCDFVLNGINLDPNYTGASAALGLPDFVQSYFDYVHKGCALSTSIDEPLSENIVDVFPNPSNGFLILNTASLEAGPFNILLTDLAGRTCFLSTEISSSATTKVKLASLNNGVYILKVTQGKKEFVQKILVSNCN
ncbi:MAG: T9SS type A sorting domain-containing protein [Chitinophagaceae bacterium]|nr:T9SS type A sorting domain-containing protein [Chitinophagaceae bacterium]